MMKNGQIEKTALLIISVLSVVLLLFPIIECSYANGTVEGAGMNAWLAILFVVASVIEILALKGKGIRADGAGIIAAVAKAGAVGLFVLVKAMMGSLDIHYIVAGPNYPKYDVRLNVAGYGLLIAQLICIVLHAVLIRKKTKANNP